jgi:hypothetical protein
MENVLSILEINASDFVFESLKFGKQMTSDVALMAGY